MAVRTLCLWCPDWPVVAARHAELVPADGPVAVIGGQRVVAVSGSARAEGVRIGHRRREAEAACPGIVVIDADPANEARVFEPIVRAVESITPRVVLERPGVLSFPTRGPSRYHGGDGGLVEHLRAAVEAAGPVEVRIGIADSGFAARLAARRCIIVPIGETPTFLASWPVGALGDDDLADLLTRLGLRTLGAFAQLPESAILARMGREGLTAHRLARGEDALPPALTTPPPDFAASAELDPPAERVDAVAFVAKSLADELLERLAARGLACTQVVIEVETEHGEHLARAWRHEGALTPGALVERVRWQLDGWLAATGGLTGGIVVVRLVPDQVIPASGRQLGFWGGDAAATDRAERVLARLQGLLGPDHVVTAVPQGGRSPHERIRWVPWGEPREPSSHSPVGRVAGPVTVEVPPWPGTIPGPAPARVLDPPIPVSLVDDHGRAVIVSARGELSAAPARLQGTGLAGGGGVVTAFAGPWAQDVRWWDRATRARRVTWQLVIDDDFACLVQVERGQAAIAAVYD
ncbi:MAG: DNA polymerase Y family protein [Acidimicrobiia bacterium]|nr:DNA polymerase Y family protein [Acidimicrobiia bacterium]